MSNPSAAPIPSPSFDQVVEGNVDVKKLSKNKYQITFSKISKFLKYQIWTKNTLNDNNDRSVYYQNSKLWIQEFNSLNNSNKQLFTPTTVMEIGNNKYLFVLNKAKLNGKGHVVFKVSTKEIELSEKKMLKIPCGHHDGVRFDIDSSPLSLPASSSIILGTTLGFASSWPFCFCVNNNTCPQGYPGEFGPLNQQVAGWSSWGYSSTNWTINGLGADSNVGSGYLFVYMNSWLCGTNINADQGPAQLVTLSAISQINALNNPNNSIGDSLSQFILNYINTSGKSLCQLMPNLINDEPLVKPTPLFFNTIIHNIPFSYLPDAPDGITKCLYISVLTSSELGFLSSTIGVSLTNIHIPSNDCNASYVTNVSNPNGPFIRIGSAGSFIFNAIQPFYQKISPNKHPHPCPPPPPPLNPRPHPPTQNICYLETPLSITLNISNY